MLDNLRPQVNHFFSRLDGGEMVRGAQPMKRLVAPGIAAVLGGAQLVFDYNAAPDGESKRKVLIRDGLVLGGIVLGLVVATKSLSRLLSSAEHIHLPGIAHLHGPASPLVKWIDGLKKSLGFKPPAHSHDHGAHTAPYLERAVSLFKSPKCDHGIEGATRLQTLAAGGILGGALGGIVADGINGEDVKHTSAIKLKEGLFQYIGNISFCTVAILAFGLMARKAASKLADSVLRAESGSLKNWLVGRTEQLVERLKSKTPGDLNILPGAASEQFETLRLMATKNPAGLKEMMETARQLEKRSAGRAGRPYQELPEGFKALKTGDENLDNYIEALQRYLNGVFRDKFKNNPALVSEVHDDLLPKVAEAFKAGDTAGLRSQLNTFYSRHIVDDLGKLTQADMQLLAKERFVISTERLGIIAGVVAGVIGGAWASNGINRGLTHALDLPHGHTVNGLFSHHASGNHAAGFLEGTVGERGIHWWDAILHLDDWPTALYIAGVHSVEALINVLYGISGFLTGTAGTDYQGIKRVRTFMPDGLNSTWLKQSYTPLNRHQGAYQGF